jgi:hypothetical protein
MLLRRVILLVGLSFGLAGCGSEEEPPVAFPDIHFSTDAPLRFDASQIEIVESFQPTFHAPEIEQNFPVPPERAIKNWVHDRLLPANPTSPNRLRVTIIDASAQESPSPPQKDLDTRYDARAEVKVEIVDVGGLTVRSAYGVSSVSRTEPPGDTADILDGVWYNMTKKLTDDLSGELERQINENFGQYLLSAPTSLTPPP